MGNNEVTYIYVNKTNGAKYQYSANDQLRYKKRLLPHKIDITRKQLETMAFVYVFA